MIFGSTKKILWLLKSLILEWEIGNIVLKASSKFYYLPATTIPSIIIVGELVEYSNSKTLYVTETIGHGSNLVTGDYSVGATGFLIENGEFKYPINEFTIAGNFKEIFQNITLANDLEFKYSTNSPTMLIEGMVVAGKWL